MDRSAYDTLFDFKVEDLKKEYTLGFSELTEDEDILVEEEVNIQTVIMKTVILGLSVDIVKSLPEKHFVIIKRIVNQKPVPKLVLPQILKKAYGLKKEIDKETSKREGTQLRPCMVWMFDNRGEDV